MTWVIVAIVVIVVVAAVWIGNTVWWTRRHGNLARRSPKIVGKGGPGVDEQNRPSREEDPSRHRP
jgi:hypothetical protein